MSEQTMNPVDGSVPNPIPFYDAISRNEKAALGFLIHNPQYIDEIDPAWLTPKGRLFYEAMLYMPSDPQFSEISINMNLEAKGKLEEVGGAAAIFGIGSDAAFSLDQFRLAAANLRLVAGVEKLDSLLRTIRGARDAYSYPRFEIAQLQAVAQEIIDCDRTTFGKGAGGGAAMDFVYGQIRSKAYKGVWMKAWKPSQFREFEIPEDFVLGGDNHLQRGSYVVLGGWPGVGKSRAALALAVSGATGRPWFGIEMHARFRTLIIQTENGENRLRNDFNSLGSPDGIDLDQWIRVTPPPPHGMAFDEPGFRRDVTHYISDFKPGVVVIDPWNAVAADDHIREYRSSLDALRDCMPDDPWERPMIFVLHHMRKKTGSQGRRYGRDLLFELAGSYAIGAAARTVYAMEPVSADPEDRRIVLTCCKANDGDMGQPGAWQLEGAGFDPCEDFDWDEYYDADGNQNGGRPKTGITDELVRDAIGQGARKRSEVVRSLMEQTGLGRTACYRALKESARHYHADNLGQISWNESTG